MHICGFWNLGYGMGYGTWNIRWNLRLRMGFGTWDSEWGLGFRIWDRTWDSEWDLGTWDSGIWGMGFGQSLGFLNMTGWQGWQWILVF